MKYRVTVMEHTGDGDGGPQGRCRDGSMPLTLGHARQTWHEYRRRTLGAARRLAEKHGRRGVQRFGGTVRHENWGTRGGDFPHAYRSATMRTTPDGKRWLLVSEAAYQSGRED
jgi:hypothetical protein